MIHNLYGYGGTIIAKAVAVFITKHCDKIVKKIFPFLFDIFCFSLLRTLIRNTYNILYACVGAK